MSSPDHYEKLLKDVDGGAAAAQDLEYFSDTYKNLYHTEADNYNEDCKRRRNLEEKKVQLEVHLNTVQHVIATVVRVRNNQDTKLNMLRHEINTSQKKCFELMNNCVGAANNIEKKTKDLEQEFDSKNLQAKISEKQHSKYVLKDTLSKNEELFKRQQELLNSLSSTTKFENLQHVVGQIAIDEDELNSNIAKSKDMLNFIKQLETKLGK